MLRLGTRMAAVTSERAVKLGAVAELVAGGTDSQASPQRPRDTILVCVSERAIPNWVFRRRWGK